MYQFVNRVCEQKLSNTKFPGTLPVSLARAAIPSLYGLTQSTFTEYVLSYKADGFEGGRFFLLFLEVGGSAYAVLLNRKMEPFYISTQVYKTALAGTLFDVEKLRLQDNSILLLIFDTLAIHGHSVTKRHYLCRLDLARLFLHLLGQHDPNVHSELFPTAPTGQYPSHYRDVRITSGHLERDILRLQVKQVFYAQALPLLSPQTYYPTDGFIWTLGAAPYSCFLTQPQNVLKWKPLERITLDFQLQPPCSEVQPVHLLAEVPLPFLECPGNYGLFAAHNNQLVLISRLVGTNWSDGIYECSWTNNRWVIVQPRTDKQTPNQLRTVILTLQNITEAISLSDIYP